MKGSKNRLRTGKIGVGMPENLLLCQFGEIIYDAFGQIPYQVGSSMNGKKWRDVDVRVILNDNRYKAYYGDPKKQHFSRKWRADVLAYSILGRHMTGLPIDFQIQSLSEANKDNGIRSALLVYNED